MNTAFKIKSLMDLRLPSRKDFCIGMTNGCFDRLHCGHIYSLNQAAQQCDYLVVLLNTDDAVKRLKGPERPFQSQDDRAYFLSSLEAVGAVVLWPHTRVTEAFELIRPAKWFKGGDYTLQTLDPTERLVAENLGVKITFIQTLPGFSTSGEKK
jgi:rfaE bifunctional protein nucleotidyltransferase chain/domain